MTISEEKIWDLLNTSLPLMTPEQKRLWTAVSILPEEWNLKGYGNVWVVAIIGTTVVFYNSYEHGFGYSPWSAYGLVEFYDSSQRDLQDVVQALINRIKDGYYSAPRTGPPIAGEYPGSLRR